MRPMPNKPPIGGPKQGRPAKLMPSKKGRIKPIPMAPTAKGEGTRRYLVGRSFGEQGLRQGPKRIAGTLRVLPGAVKGSKRRGNKPYAGPGRSKGL